MRIFNQDKTIELTEYDLEKGYLKSEILEVEVPEQQAIKEISHYEIIAEYANGGKDARKVIDVEGKPYIPAHIECEEILVYIPYTEKELAKMEAEQEIAELKTKLSETDYQAIKYAEGALTLEEYADMKAQRQAWRDRINELAKI